MLGLVLIVSKELNAYNLPPNTFNCYVEGGWEECCLDEPDRDYWGICPCKHCNITFINKSNK